MTVHRKRRRKPQRLKGAVVQGQRAVLTHNRQVARNLTGLRAKAAHHGSGALEGGGGDGGGGAADDLGRRLREAAEVIAGQARENAAGWSARIPPSIKVSGGASGVSIMSGAPPAYPNEVPGVRHPTFGHDPWRTNQHRPFLAPAADQRIEEAAEKFAQVIDDWAKEHGFK